MRKEISNTTNCLDIDSNNILKEHTLSSTLSRTPQYLCFFPDGSSTGGVISLKFGDKTYDFNINKHTSYIETFLSNK